MAWAIAVGLLWADVVPIAGRLPLGGVAVLVISARRVALITVSWIRTSYVARVVDEGLRDEESSRLCGEVAEVW